MSGQSNEKDDVERLADSIAGCLSNVSHLPEWMRVVALGRDTRPLLILAARAVLESDWLEERIEIAEHDAVTTYRTTVQPHVKADAWDEGMRTGTSRAMRKMSDEPSLPLASEADNPYRVSTPSGEPTTDGA